MTYFTFVWNNYFFMSFYFINVSYLYFIFYDSCILLYILYFISYILYLVKCSDFIDKLLTFRKKVNLYIWNNFNNKILASGFHGGFKIFDFLTLRGFVFLVSFSRIWNYWNSNIFVPKSNNFHCLSAIFFATYSQLCRIMLERMPD